jgi:hypothetical protein
MTGDKRPRSVLCCKRCDSGRARSAYTKRKSRRWLRHHGVRIATDD